MKVFSLCLLLIGIAATSIAMGGELQKPICSFGEVPSKWNDEKKDYVAEPGYGKGTYAVPLNAQRLIALSFNSDEYTSCRQISLPAQNNPVLIEAETSYPYYCDKDIGRIAFFVQSDANIVSSEELEWTRVEKGKPPFPTSGTGNPTFFEFYTDPSLLKGERLWKGAWVDGDYPPKKVYSEMFDKEMTDSEYTISDRALYLKKGNSPSFIYKSQVPLKSMEPTFEFSFLPPDYSDFSRVAFNDIYAVAADSFWIRVNIWQDHEGAGSYDAITLLEWKKGHIEVMGSCGRTHMY